MKTRRYRKAPEFSEAIHSAVSFEKKSFISKNKFSMLSERDEEPERTRTKDELDRVLRAGMLKENSRSGASPGCNDEEPAKCQNPLPQVGCMERPGRSNPRINRRCLTHQRPALRRQNSTGKTASELNRCPDGVSEKSIVGEMYHQDDDDLYEEKRLSQEASKRNNGGDMMCKPCGGNIMPLTRKENGRVLGAVGECQAKWVLLSMAVDSGACDNVIDAEEVPAYVVTQTRDSLSGDAFLSATGEEIPNLGELKLPMVTREDIMRHMTCCAAAVAKPLASVKKMVAAGHRVVFDDVSYIENKETGEINYLREEAGNYILDVWVPPPSSVNGIIGNMGFAWPSTP